MTSAQRGLREWRIIVESGNRARVLVGGGELVLSRREVQAVGRAMLKVFREMAAGCGYCEACRAKAGAS